MSRKAVSYFAWLPEIPNTHIGRMPDDELRAFVDDYLRDRIFTSANIRDPGRDLGIVFLPIALGAFEGWPREKLEEIGILWEHMDPRKMSPRSVNGMPCFFSFRIMHKDDWARAVRAIRAEEDRRKNIALPEAP